MRDYELLHDFVHKASNDAFAKIVSMHIDAVYASARRQTRDPQLADDVTQAVFIVLARKAKALDSRVPLVGWLMKTTWFACRDVLKKEVRRKKYEQEAAAMRSEYSHTDVVAASRQIEPELDDALARLSDADRTAVALRYLESNSLSEVGAATGVSQEAAAKRISRALKKLRKILVRSEAIPAAIPIGVVLESIAKVSAPVALAEKSAAVASAASAGAITNISNGVINMMIWSKAKAAAILIGLTLATAGTGLGTLAIVQAQTEQQPPPPLADPLNYRAVLKNGVSIEILGISEHPSKGRPWWRADGWPLSKAPYETAQARIISRDQGVISREIAVRINRNPTGQGEPATVEWNIRGSRGTSSSSEPLDERGRPLRNVETYAIILPDTVEGVALEAMVASGPWQIAGSVPGNSGGTIPIGIYSYLIKPPREISGKTHYSFTRSGIELAGMSRRIIAIDLEGRETSAQLVRSTGSLMSGEGEFVIPLKMHLIKELQYRLRKFDQSIVISNISMHPGRLTQVGVVTSDQPQPPQ